MSRPHRRVGRRLRHEEFEPRHFLAAVAFAAHDIACCSALFAQSVFASDVDGDGDVDVLSASSGDDKIAWYENTDSRGTFGNQRVITASASEAASVFASDMDGDGDVDVLSASFNDDKLAWYENTDGKGTFGNQRVITTSAQGAISVFASDVDGDGDVDVLSASFNDNKIAWYENTDGKGKFGKQLVITTSAQGAISVFASDVDRDGDVDVLSASAGDSKIAWYENTDGKGTFGKQFVITTEAQGAFSVYAADVDGDGDVDVLSASIRDHKIAWYVNSDGKGTFGGPRVITTEVGSVRFVFAADVDRDGDVDVLSASAGDSKIAWYENTDGKGTFGKQRVISTAASEARSVYAADVDGDGDVDVLSASGHSHDSKIAWYENTDGKGTFGNHGVITSANFAISVYADVDRDGDVDVLAASASDSKIAWYENTDGKGTFGKQRVISTEARGAFSVYAADVDGDGDVDMLSASYFNLTIAWYENTDGKGTFGKQRVITTAASGARSVYASDVEGDGDVDVLSASFNDHTIAWYENTDGKGTFGDQRVISTQANFAFSVYAADVDGDGDVDVLSASYRRFGNKIAWYENTDGKGTFGDQRVISTAAAGLSSSVYAADVDGDGDVDVLSASGYHSSGKIAWYENTDGQGIFGNQRVISTDANGATSVSASDVDGDGDVDVLSASAYDNKIAWYENTDGQGTFGNQRVISTDANGATSVSASDVDGDGDVDVLSASLDGIAWYEHRLPGDSNDDGAFNSSDLVRVFQAGEYEDGLPRNTTFDEGDWNGDQEFDSSDLVLAFQFGLYEAANPAAANLNAAAIDWLFANEKDRRKPWTVEFSDLRFEI